MALAGLAAKALPMLIDHAPELWAAAIRDLENSLLTLNAQIEKSGEIVASLARQNETLAKQIEAQRAWLVRLTIATLLSLALAIAAISGALG